MRYLFSWPMKYLHVLSILIWPLLSFSQADYWQQRVDYKIEVSLNDKAHELDGFITIDYRNNSPNAINYIYFHLWPNAFKDHTTPFAKQFLQNGDTRFWYSKQSQRGYIDSIRFKVNAEACRWAFDTGSVEICKVFLNEPLQSGGTVRISTPFHVKIPETFSRLGHNGQAYQISQWYPKPAVYDKEGWHPMPYLDQGEFYSEFGSFDVRITLPENYVVGATGELQDSSEIRWMNDKAEAAEKRGNFENNGDISFPASSPELKTIHFKQDSVHDFAWFADKRFNVLKGEVELPYSGRKVTTWSLFTNWKAKLWMKAPEYLHDAVFYYSRWLGDYPYNQVTAVDGELGAGGGMEYPTVTVIGGIGNAESLDEVITHEVGHNWLYGILANNERDHAWMDEGINSYYENRYMKRKYREGKMVELPKWMAKFADIYQYDRRYEKDLGYLFMVRENYDQPMELPSPKYSYLNSGISLYSKPVLAFDHLENYLGTAKFDTIMRAYYEAWKFKHPQPEDIRRVFEAKTNKNLSWFFDDLVKTTKKVDYKIKKVYANMPRSGNETTYSMVIRNVNKIASPFSISLMNKDSILESYWVEGIKKDTIIQLVSSNPQVNRVAIDPQLSMPEVNRKNNTYKLDRLAHKWERLKLQFIGSIENEQRTQVFYVPYLAWNNYDKTQVGLAIYSPFVPARKFSYALAPAFGTGSKKFIGLGEINYRFYPQHVQRIMLGVSAKRFSYLLFPANLMFNKVEPHLDIEFKKKDARSEYTHSLNIRSIQVWYGWLNPLTEVAKETRHYFVNEMQYKLDRSSTLHPFVVQATAQQGINFVNLAAEGNFKISYRRKAEGLRIRLFAGGFIFNEKTSIYAPNPRFYLSNVTDGANPYWLQKDYMFDENFIDRNGRDNILGRQVAITGGGFRSFTAYTGSTRRFLSSVNVSSTIYKFIPINPFASAAVTINDLGKPDFSAEMGLSLVAIRNMLEFHLPLITTNNLREQQKINGVTKWYQRITFTLKFNLPKPREIGRQLY